MITIIVPLIVFGLTLLNRLLLLLRHMWFLDSLVKLFGATGGVVREWRIQGTDIF